MKSNLKIYKKSRDMRRKELAVMIAFAMIIPGTLIVMGEIANPFPNEPGFNFYEIYGQANYNGSWIPGGERLYSWADGVQYGNCTTTSLGFFELDTMGDEIVPDLIKTGCVNGDFVYFSCNLDGKTYYASQTIIWQYEGSSNTNLVFYAGPDALKINEVCSDDGLGGQYVVIYNSESSTVDLSDYYLEKNDHIYYSGPSFNLAGTIGPSGKQYVDLGSAGFLNVTADELKLVWRNPGGPVAGGRDVVIDRVEFGTQITLPDSTSLPDAPALAPGSCIRRTPDGQDTDDCSVDFVLSNFTAIALPAYQEVNTFQDAFFNASLSTGDIINYTWDFGDRSYGSGIAASHSYSYSGYFLVTLTIWDGSGNHASDTCVVKVLGSQDPYPIYGYVKDGSTMENLAGCTVEITYFDGSLGGWHTLTTASSGLGQYMVDLNNYVYDSPVFCNVTVNPVNGKPGFNSSSVDVFAFPGGRQVDILCEDVPVCDLSIIHDDISFSDPNPAQWDEILINAEVRWNIPSGVPAVNLVKAVDKAQANPGETLMYAIYFNNTGTGDATNVWVNETYPAGVTFVNSNPLPTFGNNAWFMGNIAPGADAWVFINVTVNAWVGTGTVLTNNVMLEYRDSEGAMMPTEYGSAATMVVAPFTCLEKSGPATAQAGEAITYWIMYSNNGTDWAYDIMITEEYPAGVTFVSALPAPYISADTWFIPAIAPGGSGSIQITVLVSTNASGTLTNHVIMDSEDSVGNPTQRHAWWNTTVTPGPYLALVKTAPSNAIPGEDITYTITCTNIGSSTAYNVWINETYPIWTTFVSAVPFPTLGPNAWFVGSLLPAANFMIQITMHVNLGATGVLTNWIQAEYQNEFGVPMPIVYDSASTIIMPDITPPASSINFASPYWRNTSPITLAATAEDQTGVAFVELWYRYSPTNSSFGSWTLFGNDSSSPYSWSFSWPSGQGYYEFNSRAMDTLGNYEAMPAVPDARNGYDMTPGSQMINIGTYWKSAPFNITATATDALSGVSSVQLWYGYSPDNLMWGSWTLFGTDSTAPYSWYFSGSSGYYRLYTIVIDKAGNYEAVPGAPEATFGYDTVRPTSAADAIIPYLRSASPVTVTGTGSDSLSGLYSLELWVRYSADNATWNAWMLYTTDYAPPYSWAYPFANGTGYYQFYTRAHDSAGNFETAPATRDTSCLYFISKVSLAGAAPPESLGNTSSQVARCTVSFYIDCIHPDNLIYREYGAVVPYGGSANVSYNWICDMAGDHTVIVDVTDSDPADVDPLNNMASRDLSISEPCGKLKVQASSDKQKYISGEDAQAGIIVKVTYLGSLILGADVSCTVTDPAGANASASLTEAYEGIYVGSYPFTNASVTGTYRIFANASKPGYLPGENDDSKDKLLLDTPLLEMSDLESVALSANILSGGTDLTIAADILNAAGVETIFATLSGHGHWGTFAMPMFDDGTHSDAVPGDSIFTAAFETADMADTYLLDISVNGMAFEKLDAIVVSPSDYVAIDSFTGLETSGGFVEIASPLTNVTIGLNTVSDISDINFLIVEHRNASGGKDLEFIPSGNAATAMTYAHIVVSYTEDDIPANVSEDSLRLWVYNIYTERLEPCDPSGVDTQGDLIWGDTEHFSEFRMMSSPAGIGAYTIQLTPGWNLISVPVQQDDEAIEKVLSPIAGLWDVVKYYDCADSADPWKTYRVGSAVNDLYEVDHTMALWVHVSASTELPVFGVQRTSTQIQLHTGWNFVGYPTQQTGITVASALWGTGADRVEVMDQASPSLLTEVGPDFMLSPGMGLWVHVPAASVWTVP